MQDDATAASLLHILEALITAEIFNRCEELDGNDLTPMMRSLFGIDGVEKEIARPLVVSEGAIRRVYGISEARKLLEKHPFVKFEDFGQRFRITALEMAAGWFISHGGEDWARKNPVLAFYYSKKGRTDLSYERARESNPPLEDTRGFLERRIAGLLKADEALKSALELVVVSAPEEVEQPLEDLVLTSDQLEAIGKVKIALEHRAFLREKRIHELGKMLFVGPPGTGKTSLALALSREFHMPLLEVRLSMITSQYLGETSKNIDRVFEFAKRLSHSILFIDEFDFVAKSRLTEDHGAMKRAVNMLLKNIDRTSLVKDGVLLIAATNHPQLLDEAAWRRFDDIVYFPLPDREMRKNILVKILSHLEHECDPGALADSTDGFSGADLKVMVKEGLVTALSRGSARISMDDIGKGLMLIRQRNRVRNGA